MLIAAIGQYFFGITIFILSMFLVMLVLVQRGRGGGLAGALGGPGGQSAFGTKAGDLFTRITVVVASIWIVLCVVAVMAMKERGLRTGVTRDTTRAGSMGSETDNSPAVDLPNLSREPAATSGTTLDEPAGLKPADPVKPADSGVTPADSGVKPADSGITTEPATPEGQQQPATAEVDLIDGTAREPQAGDAVPENTLRTEPGTVEAEAGSAESQGEAEPGTGPE